VKFLDASENLSVQVHPSPAYAAAHPDANLKTECWYILSADPGAKIYKGIKPEVTREQFSKLARTNDPTLVDALIALPAIPGECHNLPSGTVHALGAGVLVAEVQTPSDTTFRLYDWGRGTPALRAGSDSGTPTLRGGSDSGTPTLRGGLPPRELHIEQSLACASFPGEPGYEALQRGLTVASLRAGQSETRLVTTEFFVVDELRPKLGAITSIGAGGPCTGSEPTALIALEGAGSVISHGPQISVPPTSFRRGDTLLIPAALAPHSMLVAGTNLRALRVGIA
jgi:mannose-6-phosphate isomerase